MRFGIGDKVLVKSVSDLNEFYQKHVLPFGVKLTDDMRKFANKIVTIKEMHTIQFSDYITIEEDIGRNVWWEEAFLPVTDGVMRDAREEESSGASRTSPPTRESGGADPVAHPAHYTYGKIEVIDFIQDKDLNFALGNAVKYIVRAGHKAEQGMSDEEKAIQDLEKARQYIDFEIEHRRGSHRGSK